MLRFSIITLFPEFFEGPLNVGQIGRAIREGILAVDLIQLREFATDKYGSVDDRSYGGGKGMVLSCGPLVRALERITREKSAREALTERPELLTVWGLSPAGRSWNQGWVEEETERARVLASKADRHFVFVCGRYEGIDQRFLDTYCDEEVSVGPFVLNGGESAAWILLESLARLQPGVVGAEESTVFESFAQKDQGGEVLLDWPHYTPPAVFRGLEVPPVLRSGHHAEVSRWRLTTARQRTARQRVRHSEIDSGRPPPL